MSCCLSLHVHPPPACPSVCPLMRLSTCPNIRPYPSMCLYVQTSCFDTRSNHILSICLSVHSCVCLSVSPFHYLSDQTSVCLCVHPSICHSISVGISANPFKRYETCCTYSTIVSQGRQGFLSGSYQNTRKLLHLYIMKLLKRNTIRSFAAASCLFLHVTKSVAHIVV